MRGYLLILQVEDADTAFTAPFPHFCMKKYNLINNIGGWACFVIAAVTYLLTVEPTASFWDCPEFIAQGAKLEVGHPPGNPIFMLTARFFVTLFGGAMSTAAVAVNVMSALLSAATILLLFWSITHLARRLMVRDGEAATVWQTIVIMAAGACGALAYTWSDTFWFSAVEGEVYAFSSFCTALVFWLMLKWENRADSPGSDRYLILIAYVIGVSIAVHLLNLLCIPALGLIYYYRKSRNINVQGSLIALLVSCVIVGAILYGLVPGFVQVAQWFELMFVNGFHMGYNSGVIAYALVLVATFITTIAVIYRSNGSSGAARALAVVCVILSGMPFIGHSVLVGTLVSIAMFIAVFAVRKITRRFLAVLVLSVFVIFIGYSSYALLLIRASANTPMNQNAPDNVFALASYLSREQYGDRPLFVGPVFAEGLDEIEYPEGSGTFYVAIDENGLPALKNIDGYLRNENGSAINNPRKIYTKVVKTDASQPDRYVEELERPDYKTMPDLNMLFTRIYSSDPAHVSGYKGWAGYTTPDIYAIPATVRATWARQGFAPKAEVLRYLPHMTAVTTNVNALGTPARTIGAFKPGFDVNLSYFINYQLNHMYWRYFMWNFAGRQNDMQGNGEPFLGNWISGIPFIDNARLGDQSKLPYEYGEGNKGHNVFYMLPLLLGVIGLLFQALYHRWANDGRGIEQFWVVFFLFFMTGIAIVLYLNQTPGQPRERDYAFAGSFYAFAIWIGLGIPAIAMVLRNLIDGKKKAAGRGAAVASASVAVVVALAVPLQMVSQTWDDHDRSGRYTTRDFGFNYLSSLDPDAIIFTNGDNDTFPLWYAQEVEGFRTDVRVVNLSYLTTDWYANQMAHPSYEAAAIPMYATPADWGYERLAFSLIAPLNDSLTNAETSLRQLYASDDARYGVPILSSPNVRIPADRAIAMERYTSGNAAFDSIYLAPYVRDITTNLTSQGSGLSQSRVLSLDMIANSIAGGMKRPVYFATTVPSSYYLGLTPFMGGSGLAYEVMPVAANSPYKPNAQKTYVKVLTDYRWGGLDGPDADRLYLDETVRRMVSSLRSGIYTAVEDLMELPDAAAGQAAKDAAAAAGMEVPQTQADMARNLLDLLQAKLPARISPYDAMLGLYIARSYLDLYLVTGRAADLEACRTLAASEAERYAELVRYGASLSPEQMRALGRSESLAMGYLAEAVSLVNRADILEADPELADEPDALALIRSMGIEDDWIIAPMLYINGYDADTLLSQIESYHPDDRALIAKAVAMSRLHSRAGVPAMDFSNQLMTQYGFTAPQWYSVHTAN